MSTHENQIRKIFRKHPAVEKSLSELGYSNLSDIKLNIKRVDKNILSQTGMIASGTMENIVSHPTKKYPGTIHCRLFLLTHDEKHSDNTVVFSRKNLTASKETVRDQLAYFGCAYSDYKTRVTGILVAYKYFWYPSEKVTIGEQIIEIVATLYLEPKESWYNLLRDHHYSLACEDAKEDCHCLHIHRTDNDVVIMAEDRRRRAGKKIDEEIKGL